MLTVYRASAGSGKTYLLAGTYLRMLFHENTTFDNILAVTFTNKATEEMKDRILNQLHLLSISPEQSGYCEQIAKEFSLSNSQIKVKAQSILRNILHNYSRYNVSTIDHFFQNTTRAFTREIGLQGGYNVELDSDKVLTEAVDRLIANLSLEENKELLDWLLIFTNQKIESGQDWNIRNDLLSLAKEILKEEYKKNSESILQFTQDKKNLTRYIETLQQIKKDFESFLKELATEGLRIIASQGLQPTDFSGKSRSPFLIFNVWKRGEYKEPSATFINLVDNLPKWAPAKSPKSAEIEAAYQAGLNEVMNQAIQLFNTSVLYVSATESLRFIYTVGILSDIDRNMREYSKENNLMLISDTTELLNKVIDGKDTPFLYEKIGTRIKHFMIDEFQDTSSMQWDNFKPLLDDSIALGEDNLIVGDVKQSIYRWRNSDLMLLHKQLRSFHNNERKDLVLDTNWRSARNVVTFNNSFFTQATTLLQEKYNEGLDEPRNTIEGAYGDICQNISSTGTEKEGHTRVTFYDDSEDTSWQEKVLTDLPETLMHLQDNGYALKDIAILVRRGSEGAQVAETLLRYKTEHPDTPYRFDIISNDSLYVSQANIIKTIVSFMSYLLDPSITIDQIVVNFNIAIQNHKLSNDEALANYFKEPQKEMMDLLKSQDIDLDEIRNLPLYELSERIIEILTKNSDQQDKVYIQAFQDLILDFINSQSADLSAFLTWWNEKGVTKTISTPDSQDAIRIMTIHKSKGLGFKATIIPFAAWSIDHEAIKSNIIWCQPQVEPFNQIPLLPLRYNKSLINTIYKEDYLREKQQAFIDNLNLAYVAFTRAEEELIIYAPLTKKPENLSKIGDLLYMTFVLKGKETDKPNCIALNEQFDIENNRLELGQWWQTKPKKEAAIEELQMPPFRSIDPGNRLQLRLHGKGYFHDKEERLYGNLMHNILSAIRHPQDVPQAVSDAVTSGVITEQEAEPLTKRIASLLEQPGIAPWFAQDVEVFNETDILVSEGSFLRPDRVIQKDDQLIVIDYKFGKVERPAYQRQIENYMTQMIRMGYKEVKGFLWYVELEKTVPVYLKQLSLF